MKKIYLAPQTEQVMIKSQRHLMDLSFDVTNETATKTNGYYDTDARKSDWFDDEEDEDY